MNYGIVTKLVGRILILETIILTFPLVISLVYGQSDSNAFVITMLITGAVGIALSLFPAKDNTIKVKEGLSIVSFSWISMSLFGSLPFLFSGSVKSFADAFFETVSGFTTTGLPLLKMSKFYPTDSLLEIADPLVWGYGCSCADHFYIASTGSWGISNF